MISWVSLGPADRSVMVMLAKESFASTKKTRRSSAKQEANDFLLKGLPKGDLEASIREVRCRTRLPAGNGCST